MLHLDFASQKVFVAVMMVLKQEDGEHVAEHVDLDNYMLEWVS